MLTEDENTFLHFFNGIHLSLSEVVRLTEELNGASYVESTKIKCTIMYHRLQYDNPAMMRVNYNYCPLLLIE